MARSTKDTASALAVARAKLAARRSELALPNPSHSVSKLRKPAKAAKPRKVAKPARKPTSSTMALPLHAKKPARKAPRAVRPLSVSEILAHNAGALRPNPVHRPGTQPALISTRPTLGSWNSPQENPMATLTPEQQRALAAGRAKFAAMKGGGAASKPASAKKSSKKAKKSSKKPASARKSSRKPASRRPSARPASVRPTIIAVPVPAASPRKSPRKSPKKARKAKRPTQIAIARQYVVRAEKVLARKPKAKKTKKPVKKGKLPKSIQSGKYQSKKHGAITIRRAYPSANPVVEFKQIAFAGGGLLLGIVAADLLDRYVATRAPAPPAGATTTTTDPLFLGPAVVAIQKKADGYRMLASGGGTLAFGLGAYLLREKAPNAAYGLGGVGAGFGVKFLSQLVSDVIMPLIFKADPTLKDDKAKTLGNRLYPDKYEAPETAATPASLRWSGYYRGLPYMGQPNQGVAPAGYAGRFPFVQAPARSVGPAATGAVGCGGGGCATSALRNAYGWDMNKVFPTPSAAPGFGPLTAGPCTMCAGQPTPVAPPNGIQPIEQIPPGYEGIDQGQPNGLEPLPAQPGGMQPLQPAQPGTRLSVTDQKNAAWNLALREAQQSGFVKGPDDGQVAAPAETPNEGAEVMSIGDLVRMNSRKSRRR